MTKINIKKSRDWISGKFEVSMSGHSGFNPGNDIVCSALSCLFFALSNYLDYIGADPFVEYDTKEGKGFIKCCGGLRVRFAVDFCIYAFKMLELTYPDYVSVSIS